MIPQTHIIDNVPSISWVPMFPERLANVVINVFHRRVSVVDQNIQLAILTKSNFVKQFFDLVLF